MKIRLNTAKLLTVFSLGGAFLASSCGPVASLSYMSKANVSIELAKSAGADTLAIYEYTTAVAYYQKAQEENGYSDFVAAEKYAKIAHEQAMVARERAEALSTIPN